MGKKGGKDRLQELLRHAKRATDCLESMVARGSGWERCSSEADVPQPTRTPTIGLYCWDQPTDRMRMCVMPLALFLRLSSDSARRPQLWLEIQRTLATTISRCADLPAAGRAMADGDPPDLGVLTALYAGTTKVWAATGRLAERGQFVVMNCRAPAAGASTLVPLVLPRAHDDLLTPEQLLRVVRKQATSTDHGQGGR